MSTAQESGRQLRILISYHYYKDCDLDELYAKYFRQPYPDTFLDSGAYSASTQGASISVDDYAAYAHRYSALFSVVANLDVIGDPEATARNQQALEDLGLNPLPVFHVGEPWIVLERLCERYDYIGLGGMVPYSGNKGVLLGWLARCFKIAGWGNARPFRPEVPRLRNDESEANEEVPVVECGQQQLEVRHQICHEAESNESEVPENPPSRLRPGGESKEPARLDTAGASIGRQSLLRGGPPRGPIGFHGFGMTSWKLMEAFPWRSVDSSSWGQGFRFGTVPVFDMDRGKFCKVDLRNVQQAYKQERLLQRYGFSPNDLCVHGRYDRAKICALSAMSYMEAELWLNRYWGNARPFRICNGKCSQSAIGAESLGSGVLGGELGSGRAGPASLRLAGPIAPFVAGGEVTSPPATPVELADSKCLDGCLGQVVTDPFVPRLRERAQNLRGSFISNRRTEGNVTENLRLYLVTAVGNSNHGIPNLSEGLRYAHHTVPGQL